MTSAPATEPEPPEAAAIFGPQLPLARRYAHLLADDGITRGLLGPREPARLWTRHLLNCAAVSELFEAGSRVVDVGSGAGLPGLVLALRRVDLRVDLVEPLQRRVDFLIAAVQTLELGTRVRVTRGRADEPHVVRTVGGAAWVTARAVAPLDRLVSWCFPLLSPAGRLAAFKGSTAAAELAEHRATLTKLGSRDPRIVECGSPLVSPPVTVVVMGR